MKLKVKYNVGKWIMWGYGGRALYPFMLFAKSRDDVPDWLFRHELEHIYQAVKLGWWRFHLKYLWYLIRYGYGNNPFELEAVEKSADPLTEVERHWKDTL
jgi:hypothetical protein